MNKAISFTLALSIFLTTLSFQAQANSSSIESASNFVSPKLYSAMSEAEQQAFISERARFVSGLFVKDGNEPLAVTQAGSNLIKSYVDNYAKRAGNQSTRLWAEDTRLVLERGLQHSPVIARTFESEGVPAAIGIYLAMIETEFRANLTSPANTKGMFQLMPLVAEMYGTKGEEIWDVQKSAQAAARYLKARLGEFGSDGFGTTLSVLSYTRSPKNVQRDFQPAIQSPDKDGVFWSMLANPNKHKFDRLFLNESIKYVPKFYAAAIIGETPEAFGIQTQPLSKVAQ